MDPLLALPAAVIVSIAVFQVRRCVVEGQPGRIADLAESPVPTVELDYLRARVPERDHAVRTPVTGGVSLGARLLAADRRSSRTDIRAQGAIRRRRRGEPLVARR